MMTEEQLESVILAVSNRFNSVLFDSVNMYTDGIKNISDLKLQYGRLNGEKWVNNFTYLAGEIVSFGQDIFLSLQNNNLNHEVSETSWWLKIYSSNLSHGRYFAAAFCNITMFNNYVLTFNNNFNIASAAWQSYQGVISGVHFLEVKFKESANITNDQYLVFPMISRTVGVPTNDSNNNQNNAWQRPQQIQVYNKTITGFTVSTEYYNNRELSFIVIPKQY